MSEELKIDTASENAEPSIQEILHKVILAHQQSLSLLQQTEAAYSRLIPHQLLNLLEVKSIVDVKLGDQVERKMSIMFTDIRDFTPLSESMTPAENFEFINSYLSQMEPVISQHRGIIDKYIGDAIMALFDKGADDAVSGAIAMLTRLGSYNEGRVRAGYPPIRIGIGLNTGRVMIGTVGGTNRMDSTVIGDPVNLAARIEEATKTYDVPLVISHNTLYDLIYADKFHIRFLDRIRVKGKYQPLSIYEVFDNDADELRNAKAENLDIFEQAVAYYQLKDIDLAIPLFQHCVEQAPNDVPAQIYLQRCYDFLATGSHSGTDELNTLPTWKDEFQTGLAEVDGAHQALLSHIIKLADRIRNKDVENFSEIFPLLDQHIQNLFPFEEAMMHEHGYPFAISHAHEHKRFIENYIAIEQRTLSGDGDPLYLAYRTELVLLDWFAAHATKSDRHFARFMQNAKTK